MALQKERQGSVYEEHIMQRWRQICFPRHTSEPDDYLCDHAHFITPLNNPRTNIETGQVWVPGH